MNIWSRINTFGSFSNLIGDPPVDGACYIFVEKDPPFGQDSDDSRTTSDEMDHAYCNDYCERESLNYNYYAVRNGTTCSCGRKVSGAHESADDRFCKTLCALSTSTEYCGGDGYYMLFDIDRDD